jgi:phosphoribosyl-ATP pyrophosphohydrolase/phosphoribosyl-AMP cyclohydrolase
MKTAIDEIKYDEKGLVPAVVQDAVTGEVLTLAYMNAESLRRTLEERETWFWSRSRSELWHKGATSGNTQRVVEIRPDCDNDAVVVKVVPSGPACHTGERSCFHGTLEHDGATFETVGESNLGSVLEQLHKVIQDRFLQRPEGSYTSYLFEKGLDKILKKVGEESAETIIAAKNADTEAFVREASDLVYHLLVLLVQKGVGLEQLATELSSRSGRNEAK